jgi:arylsulfatase A-like enzyme
MLLLALMACSRPSVVLPEGDPSRPDVILVVVDALRADRIGPESTPNLDALGGVRFTSAWAAAPWALPSTATILSGALPIHHGAIDADRPVLDGIPWLPDAFADAGYGTDRGAGLRARALDEALAAVVASPAGEAQLVYAHLDELTKPPRDLPRAGWYDAEVGRLDQRLGAFLDVWKQNERDAIVMIVGSHGEELGERGVFGHGDTLWPSVLHVPWMVAGPGIEPREVTDRIGLEDVAPTLAALAGVPFAGRDLVAAGFQPAAGSGRFAETSRGDQLKLRWHDGPYDLHADLRAGTLQLCDLRDDPACEKDVAAEHYEVTVLLEKAMYDWIGTPFEAVQPGTVLSSGVFVVYGQRAPGRLVVHDRVRFALLPADAPFAFTSETGLDGGPWQVLGGALPDEVDPVRYDPRP